ncbi:multisubunit sodium/proton antiporter, MrpD subunit [Anaerobranca californiensis DSM 14826]|jgi:multicomponent Na+:H+ antiporter subunit D|uniref:Multisubunit sodium/proton antiporter, MrpD subunit n=1 Tax=Anaerobranca californiensis DSM 14826 TaxID=1120989 RepID=A0A1M6NK39_9FIRM|nr:proton-conducting transporter membrane subunit [Anaerobranca californiensis]SHJ96039.1 multisubunit sodium/proton antiporter, MrpD subunit [Anaerobranca californiensis DSM 14826]
MSHLPILTIVLCLFTAFSIPLIAKLKPHLISTVIKGVLIFNSVGTFLILRYINKYGSFQYYLGGWQPPWGITISIDYLGIFMLLVINIISLLITIYAEMDICHEIGNDNCPWFYTLFILLVGAMSALVLSNDLFNIFVFTEIATITACGIIAVKPNKTCVEASFKYLMLSTLGSGLILLGIALLYMVTGHFNLDFIAEELSTAIQLYPLNIIVSLALFIIGFGIKSALFPLHVWLPDAHSSAPSPSSAILSGVVVKIYAIVLLRIIYKVYGIGIFTQIPIPEIILVMATLAIFAGSLFAIAQEDIKRMLAFSSVAQIGYIFLGIALLNLNSVSGGILHIANHAMMKSLLFLAAGAIIYKTGVRKISDLEGIGFKMPITMVLFSIGALSMVGIPGFNGFISKYYLVIGALDAHKPFYALVIIISSLLNAVYYLPIVIKAFFGQKENMSFDNDGIPKKMLIPMVLLGAACIIFGLVPGNLFNLVQKAAEILLTVN